MHTEVQLIQQHSLKCQCEILSQDVTSMQSLTDTQQSGCISQFLGHVAE